MRCKKDAHEDTLRLRGPYVVGRSHHSGRGSWHPGGRATPARRDRVHLCDFRLGLGVRMRLNCALTGRLVRFRVLRHCPAKL